MVPAARLELARPCERQILSLLCLPIPPRGQRDQLNVNPVKMQEDKKDFSILLLRQCLPLKIAENNFKREF